MTTGIESAMLAETMKGGEESSTIDGLTGPIKERILFRRLESPGTYFGIKFDEQMVAAYNLAFDKHANKMRLSGEQYISHCVEVAKIIHDEWGIRDKNYLMAALLHDVVEDSDVTVDEIGEKFGIETAELVDGVTKLKMGTDIDTLKKVLGKSFLNPGVAVIKLADRLHNIRTLGYMPEDKQKEKATETLHVYARLAESLGMWTVKTELEDLSFPYLFPDEYKRIKNQIDGDLRTDHFFIDTLTDYFKILVPESVAEPRQGGYWELEKKREALARLGKCQIDNFGGIDDVVSFRVRVKTKEDCYRLLYKIHDAFGKEVDFDRTDIFIGANKRINGYEAIHTTIKTANGLVEIALVTNEMEDFNNLGVISQINNGEKDLSRYTLKLVFTSSGSIRFMLKDATGFDVAAMINPQLLADATSMMVDGTTYPLSTVIPNAATVEILTTDKPRRMPMKSAEDNCALPETKKTIKDMRLAAERERLIAVGITIFSDVLPARGLLNIEDLEINLAMSVLRHFNCLSVDDLYFMVGNESINKNVLNEALDKMEITKDRIGTSIRVIGRDEQGILAYLSGVINHLDGNIVLINQQNNRSFFDLRMVIHNLSPEQETILRQFIENDNRFVYQIVV